MSPPSDSTTHAAADQQLPVGASGGLVGAAAPPLRSGQLLSNHCASGAKIAAGCPCMIDGIAVSPLLQQALFKAQLQKSAPAPPIISVGSHTAAVACDAPAPSTLLHSFVATPVPETRASSRQTAANSLLSGDLAPTSSGASVSHNDSSGHPGIPRDLTLTSLSSFVGGASSGVEVEEDAASSSTCGSDESFDSGSDNDAAQMERLIYLQQTIVHLTACASANAVRIAAATENIEQLLHTNRVLTAQVGETRRRLQMLQGPLLEVRHEVEDMHADAAEDSDPMQHSGSSSSHFSF